MVAIVGTKDNEEAHARDEDSDSVGMVEVVEVGSVGFHIVSVSGGVPLELNGEKYEDRNDAHEGAFVECGAMDAEEEVHTIYSFEVVNHCLFGVSLMS